MTNSAEQPAKRRPSTKVRKTTTRRRGGKHTQPVEQVCDRPWTKATDEPEIIVNIERRKDVLQRLGVSDKEYDAALKRSLDRCDSEGGDDVAPLYELPVVLNGIEYRLEDVAVVQITGDPDVLKRILGEESPK